MSLYDGEQHQRLDLSNHDLKHNYAQRCELALQEKKQILAELGLELLIQSSVEGMCQDIFDHFQHRAATVTGSRG